jgi:hypothetical protein
VDEELLRRAVQERVPDDLLPAEDPHELLLEEVLECPGRIHAPDRLDLGNGHGLPVGEDRERLERRGRQARAVALPKELTHERADRGLRRQAKGAGDLLHDEPPRPVGVARGQELYRGPDGLFVGPFEGGGDLLGVHGLPRREEDGLDRRHELGRFHGRVLGLGHRSSDALDSDPAGAGAPSSRRAMRIPG